MSERTVPEPPTGTRYLTGPLPDPPERGWWLDPDDLSLMRYHNGKGWTEQTTPSTETLNDFPQYQGAFPLGAGKDGIAFGQPLRPVKGRYFRRWETWAVCMAFAAGAILFVGGAPSFGLLMMGVSLSIMVLVAWRAGYRPPVFLLRGAPLRSKLYAAAMLGMCIAVILVPWVAPAFDRDSTAYEWTNRIGILSLFGALVPYAFVAILYPQVRPDQFRSVRFSRVILPIAGVFLLMFFGFALWDRLLEALWLK